MARHICEGSAAISTRWIPEDSVRSKRKKTVSAAPARFLVSGIRRFGLHSQSYFLRSANLNPEPFLSSERTGEAENVRPLLPSSSLIDFSRISLCKEVVDLLLRQGFVITTCSAAVQTLVLPGRAAVQKVLLPRGLVIVIRIQFHLPECNVVQRAVFVAVSCSRP